MVTPRSSPGTWHKLLKQPLVTKLIDSDDYSHSALKWMIRTHRLEVLHQQQQQFTLLRSCRPTNRIDPILTIPMTTTMRSRCIRWLTGGSPKPCHCGTTITKAHIITCLHHHALLSIRTSTTTDPISFLLNKLPCSPPQNELTIKMWQRAWPRLQHLLLQLELLQHPQDTEQPASPDDPFLSWLIQPPPPRPTTTYVLPEDLRHQESSIDS